MTIARDAGTFNVVDYFSGRDDTAAIQAAIDAAILAQGGRVVLPAGRYKITRTILVQNAVGLIIEGAGARATQLLWEGPESLGAPSICLELSSCQHVQVRDFGILVTSPYRLDEGVRLSTLRNSKLVSTRCSFTNFGVGASHLEVETCVRIGGDTGSQTSPDIDYNNDFHAFRDCTFANYGREAVAITDTQVYQIYFDNCMLQGARSWAEDPSPSGPVILGSIDVGSSRLLTRVMTGAPGEIGFGEADVGKVIEIAGAGDNGQPLRARIAGIAVEPQPSPPSPLPHPVGIPIGVDLADVNAPTRPVLAKAAVHDARLSYGAQYGINNAAGSFTFIGGGGGGHLHADIYVGPTCPGACTVRDSIFETSRQLLVTASGNGAVMKRILIDDVRWSGSGLRPWAPFAIECGYAAGLLVMNSLLGDPWSHIKPNDPNAPLLFPLQIALGATVSGFAQTTFINTLINSTVATPLLFPWEQPREMINCRHTGLRGIALIGPQPSLIPEDQLPVKAGQTVVVDWGKSRVRRLVIEGAASNGPVVVSFANLPYDPTAPQRLEIVHQGGPYTVSWGPSTLYAVLFPAQQPPPASRANGTDVYEFSCGIGSPWHDDPTKPDYQPRPIHGRLVGAGY